MSKGGMIRRLALCLVAGAICIRPAFAQITASEPQVPEKAGKQLHALRITGSAPRVDGRLDDEVWTVADRSTTSSEPDNLGLRRAMPSSRSRRRSLLSLPLRWCTAEAAGIRAGLGRDSSAERQNRHYVRPASRSPDRVSFAPAPQRRGRRDVGRRHETERGLRQRVWKSRPRSRSGWLAGSGPFSPYASTRRQATGLSGVSDSAGHSARRQIGGAPPGSRFVSRFSHLCLRIA